MFKSIKWRLTLIFFAVTSVFLFLLGVYLMDVMEQYSYNNTQTRILSYARLMSDNLKEAFTKPSDKSFFQDYAQKATKDINARVTIIDTGGRVLGDSILDKDSLVNHANSPEIKQALSGKIGQSVRFSTVSREKMIYFAVPVVSDRTVIGVV